MADNKRTIENFISHYSEYPRYDDASDVRRFGSLADAITAKGSTAYTLFVADNQTISTAVTVPSNITIMMIGQGKFTKSGSGTLAINGNFEAGNRQVFSGFTTGLSFGPSIVLNPKWWGAVGDGTTDDQPAIQSCINALEASGGGNIHFPSGSYKATSLHDASQALAIDFTGTQNTRPISLTGNNASLLTASANAALILINIAGSVANGYIQNLNVSGLRFVGTRTPTDTDIDTTQGNQLLYLTYCENVNISNNIFQNCNGSGIYYFTKKMTVVDNKFLDCNGGIQGSNSQNVVIARNTIICTKKADDQIGIFGISTGLSKNIKITDNLIDKGYAGGATRGWARAIIVGDYVSNVEISNNQLQNINSTNSTDRATVLALGGIIVEPATRSTSNVTISNNSISNVRWGIYVAELVNNLKINDNNIFDAESWGIFCSSSSTTVQGDTAVVVNNTLTDVGDAADTGLNYPGIQLSGYNNILIEGNVMVDTNLPYPIFVSMPGSTLYSTNVSVLNNMVNSTVTTTDAATAVGIYLSRTSNVKVCGNTINFKCVYGIENLDGATTTNFCVFDNILKQFTGTGAVWYATVYPIVINDGNYEIPFSGDLSGRHRGRKINVDNTAPVSYIKENAMPTSGAFATGDIVYTNGVADAGANTIIGWLRITTGSNNVLNTDWKAMKITV